jgi:cytochrome c oxidase cbb3-type subunit 2
MNRHPLSGFLLICSLAFGMAVLGSQASPNPNGSHEHETDDRGVLRVIAQAPAKTREWKNPYEDQPDAVLAGKKLFMRHCAECHGAHARGIGRALNLHLPYVQRATPGELEWFLRNGNVWAGMPSWSGLPEQRRWQIVNYLKSLR